MTQTRTETRTITGVGAAALLRGALERPGRPGRVARLMEQINWRGGTRILLDGEDLGPAPDQVAIETHDIHEPQCITTMVTSAVVAGIHIPLSGRSRALAYEGAGVWTIGGRRIEVVQPDPERHTFA